MADIIGTSSDDTITGTNQNDSIFGLEGADVLMGLLGLDRLDGGPGGDSIFGGEGSDILVSFVELDGTRDILLDGGEGEDVAEIGLYNLSTSISFAFLPSIEQVIEGITIRSIERIKITSGLADDSLSGGAMDDLLNGGSGDDLLSGEGGNDQLSGGVGTDSLFGGSGNDSLSGDGHDAVVDGGPGSDFVFLDMSTENQGLNFILQPAIDQIVNGTTIREIEAIGVMGTSQDDVFGGGQLTDILYGSDGNDTLITSPGSDFFDGNSGSDTAIFSGTFGDYQISSSYINEALIFGGTEGGVQLFDVETIKFADQTVSLSSFYADTAPTDIIMNGGAVFENSLPGTVVATFTGFDSDVGDTLSYTLLGDVPFALDPSTGVLTVAEGAILDFESTAQFDMTVVVTDSYGAGLSTQFHQEEFRITISDANDPPEAAADGEPFVPRSGDFLVNTTTIGQQIQPSVAALVSGGFVVSWTDDSGAGADASFAGIKAQVFDASGAALGPEFLVNTDTFLKQESPSLAALSSGRFVVAWTDQDAEIKAQLFDVGGGKVGPEVLVSSGAAIGRILPATASLISGGFVVTWVAVSDEGEDTSAHAVKAQIFDASGVKVGAEFLVNTTTLNTQYGPTVASLPSGGFVVSWFDNSGIGGDAAGYAIKGQIFDAAGEMSGEEFLVNTETAGDQLNPTITSLASGGFVVSWGDAGGSDGSGYGIKAQIFDQAGSRVGTEFLVNTVTAADQLSPKVSPLASGGFVITWVDDSGEGGDGGSHGIKAQIFDDAGRKIGSEFLLNSTTAGVQDAPTISELASGALVAAWSDISGLDGDDSLSGIKARIFDPSSSIIVTSEDVGLIIVPVTLNDSDVDGDALTVTRADVLGEGLGTAVADIGDVRYAPLVYNHLGPNESAVVQIGYTISDGRGGTDDAVITVTVLGANDTPTGVATISGTAIESEVLIASNDLVDPEGVGEVSYQWNRDGLAIVGAASSTYVLTAADVGAAISVTARYTDGGGTLESVTSEATARILSAPRTFTFTGNNNANTFIAPDDANWIVNGFGGSDSLTTRAGRDQVSGGAGNDTIDTGANDDVVYFTGTNGGFDSVTGGLGSDRIQATSNGTVIGLAALAGVELVASGGFTGVSIAGSAAANSLDFRSITLTGIERINAGGGVDTVLGSAGGDVIVGGAGNDVLSGGGGDDLFEVGLSAGTDRYDGGEGYDRIVALGPNVTIGLGALAGIEAISGGAFANVLIQGTSAADQLDFSDIVLSGILSINAAGGNDAITGSQGGDTIIGGGGDDVIDSLGGSDILIDGSGAGRLIGGTGDDNLTGDGGEDILEGGEDADRLTGGAGRDQLLGGGENDIFAYLATTDSRSANNRDTILDFQQGLDLIDLSVIDASSLVAGNNAFTFIGEAAFSRRAGQLHYRNIGADTVLEGDVDGDSRADFQVLIIGSVEIQAGDLLI